MVPTTLQEIIAMLPQAIGRLPAAVLLGIGAGGAVLGFAGARFSRPFLTLSLVAGGTLLGLNLPKWLDWGIDPMGPAFAAAIVLGLSGYLLSRWWEGMLLGAVLALVYRNDRLGPARS